MVAHGRHEPVPDRIPATSPPRTKTRGVAPPVSSVLITLLALWTALPGPARAEPTPETRGRLVRVGIYQNKPKVFLTADGQAAGLFVELLTPIAKAEHWNLQFVPCSWAQCLEQVGRGQIDLMPDVAYSRERDADFSFHRTPVLESWSQVYARQDAEIHALADLTGLQVATLRDSIQQASFAQMLAGFGIEAQLVPRESMDEVFEAVRDGTAHAAIANHFFGDYFHSAYGLVRTSIVFQVAELYFATGKNRHPDLLEAVERHLTEWRAEPNSHYYATLARWMDRPPVRLVPQRLLWTIAVTAGMLVLAIVLILVLRAQVRSRTRHLLQAHEELRQAQKMEAIGMLAGGVAHDFNNQLTVILSYADLALARLGSQNSGRQELGEIAAAARRAATLTHQLLAFSRKQVLEIRPVNLNQVVTGLVPMLQRVLGEDVTLRLTLDPTLGMTKGDPGQLDQVFMNLVVNARDAMPTGGNLAIQTANVTFDDARVARHVDVTPGPYVMLAVTDTGCGMDAATRQRVFEPFFTTKERGKGTGLGLSSAYGIVKQIGGHIWVYSEPGRGTTFKIYLPRTGDTPAVPEVTASLPDAMSRGHETILLVEDETSVRRLTTQILQEAGYTVLVAAGADQARRFARSHESDIHLLLTDIILPGIRGTELAAEIVSERPGLRVLFMSGYADDAVLQQGVLESGSSFIGKPFTVHDLTHKVRATLLSE